MSTAANVRKSENGHWYHPDGKPCYEIAKKDGSGMRPTTLADARKLNLLPSVTTILNVLEKPALTAWKIEQAVLASLTSPRQPGEADDAFVERILHVERVQDQESQIARDRGTAIHDAMECFFTGQAIDPEIHPWILPAAEAIATYGTTLETEACLVGEGYGGRTDFIQDGNPAIWIWDWKSAKKLPDPAKGGAWSEHRLQAAAYARAYQQRMGENRRPIRTGNVYISTLEQGKFVICEHGDWEMTYWKGFAPLLIFWQWQTGYQPQQARPTNTNDP